VPMSYWVYILQNTVGKFYIGSTDNIEQRVLDHNAPGRGHSTFTHRNGPWVIVWSEQHPTRAAAIARERHIKSMKSSRWIRETLLNG